MKNLVRLVIVDLSLTTAAAGAGELSPATASAPVALGLPDLEGRERSLGGGSGQGGPSDFLGVLVHALHRGDADPSAQEEQLSRK